jgi:hypothetical protein
MRIGRLVARARFTAVLFTNYLLACPLCHTETGRQVRAGIFDVHFSGNLLYTLLPFPLFLFIVAFIYYRFPINADKAPECRDK